MHGVTARTKLPVCENAWSYREEKNYLCVKMQGVTERIFFLPVCENAWIYREEQNYLCVKMHGVTERKKTTCV